MSSNVFSHAKISHISAVVPPETISIFDELEYFGGSEKKAKRMASITGMENRRVSGPGVTPADLCQQAAEHLFNGFHVDTDSVDALVFVTQHPDHMYPATACILQHKLGLSQRCAAFDVNQGCAGYVYGLWLAFSLVEAGSAKRVLLLAGDGLAHLSDRDNRVIAPLFCDCGTATLVEHSPEESPSWFSLGTDGKGAELLMLPAGGARLPLPRTAEEYRPYCDRLIDRNGVPWRLNWTYMDGGAVFDFTLNVVPNHIAEAITYAGKNVEDLDFFVPHQANKQIMQTIAEKVGFPEDKVVMDTFSKYGNAAVASIPLALCDALHGAMPEKKLSLLLSGYGIGLAWGSAVLNFDHVQCAGVRDYVMAKGHPMPEDYLAYWQQKITGEAKE